MTGPLESAQLAGVQTMHEFARFLFPDLNTEKEPPRRMLDGLYQWPEEARQSLTAARYEELFRQLAADKPGAVAEKSL